ncbi:unnamed protein product [Peniophora sp. CBMAI 1063]|nr:unnamed protein product [Peniophora sp. CBMAI 1063]
MDFALSIGAKDDEIRDLRREVARLNRVNNNLNARLQNEVTAYEGTISDLQEDLRSARQGRTLLESNLEDALHAASKHQEACARTEAALALAQQQRKDETEGKEDAAKEALIEAMEEAERRFRIELAAVLGQRDAQKEVTARVERLLQDSIDRTKAEEDGRLRAENALTRLQAEYAFTKDALSILRKDFAAQTDKVTLPQAQIADNAHGAGLMASGEVKRTEVLAPIHEEERSTIIADLHRLRTELSEARCAREKGLRAQAQGGRERAQMILEVLKTPVPKLGLLNGTLLTPYRVTVAADVNPERFVAYESICVMPEYEGRSFEELRWNDYQMGCTSSDGAFRLRA